MSAYLIERVLVPKNLVASECNVIPVSSEFVKLLSAEVLRPAARMVPMRRLELVLIFLGDNYSLRTALLVEVLQVD